MRNGYLDAVRVIGIIAVVLGHIEALGSLRDVVYPWHVPIFFVLSGWFWTRGRSLGREMSNRWRTLALPYLTWFVLVSVVFVADVALAGGHPVRALIGPLAGGAHAVQPYSAYWFISALAVAAVAARAIEASGLPVAGQLAVGLGLCVLVQVQSSLAAESPWAIAQGIGCVVYVQVGMLLRQVRRSRGLAVGALVVGIAIAALPGVRPLDLKIADFGTPGLSFLASLLICAGLVLAPVHLGGRASRVASLLAGAGLAVILGHALVLWLWTGILPTPVLVLVALVLPWAVGLGLARMPWGYLFGCTRPTEVTRQQVATG